MLTQLAYPEYEAKIIEGLAAVTQPPSITWQSREDYIVDPRDNVVLQCEARGNPAPTFWWSKDGGSFDPDSDPHVRRRGDGSGTFTVDLAAVAAAARYQGVYRCWAGNRAGTALSNNITVRLARAPRWPREQLAPVMAAVGSPAVLHCRPPPHGFPPPTVFWLDSSVEKVPLDGRVTQGPEGDLHFANVLPGDEGDYVCHARYPHTGTIRYKQPLRLVVTRKRPSKSRPVFVEPAGESSSKVVLTGETLLLTCITRGLPTPEVSWSKWGGMLLSSDEEAAPLAAPPGTAPARGRHDPGTTLAIRNATLSHGGSYQCRAVNSEGVALHTVTVTVEAKPHWFAPLPESRSYAPGDSAKLTCFASGIPAPTIRWFLNGVPIDEAPAVPDRRVDRNFLTLTRLREEDTGVYQCQASNRHGTILANAYVNVLAVAPRMLSKPDRLYTATEGQAAYLECAVFGLPRPNILWFQGDHGASLASERHQTFANGTLLISDLSPADSDTYTCYAVNKLHHQQLQARLYVEVASSSSEPGAVSRGDPARPSATPRTPQGEVTGLWDYITTTAATDATTADSTTTTTTTRQCFYGVSTASACTPPGSGGGASADDARSSSEEEAVATTTQSPFVSPTVGVVVVAAAMLPLVTLAVVAACL
ncbi:neuronal cell adhesion molecule-like [Lethenteron reissneri]|uniref:neuronal cell adhesion molecule-like n=1 Tax=Lethenteron reissneri TaxID=7753 RepID=UPI002AB75E16|nr:neuronal cell adhesion molecule-like [Lethenteron reissneri]